jgi:phage gp16-like protein
MKITKLKAHYVPRTVAIVKSRLADLGSIHAAKSQLDLSEEDYRAMVKVASGGASDSSADLDGRQRKRLIKAMEAKGYKEPDPKAMTADQLERRGKRLEDLGFIHQGQRALGLSEEAYRKLVAEASGFKTKTSADMNAAERSKLLAKMRALGHQPQARKATENTA